MTDIATHPTPAGRRREQLVQRLITRGWIRTPRVQAAFRRVPRDMFVPAGVDLDDAYRDDIVVTKRRTDGRASSSVSAPWLQAYMLEQAQLEPGHRVLEIGSGGYNAALAAEIVGPSGTVVSVDIDPDIVAGARAALATAGYPQVRVVCGDGEHGYAPGGPYDAVIVTANATDVAPTWAQQLTGTGRVVVPLKLRGHTRCLTLTPRGDHLAATAMTQCGFIAMQGEGRSHDRRIALHDDAVVLLLDDDTTAVNADALITALLTARMETWSPVTITLDEGTGFESLQLWLASQPGPYGVLLVDRDRAANLVDPQDRFTCPTLLTSDSLAYLTMRKKDENRWQFGAHGFGPDAATLTGQMIQLITAWDRDHRHTADPSITVHPADAHLPASDQPRLLVPRRHTVTAITWPGHP